MDGPSREDVELGDRAGEPAGEEAHRNAWLGKSLVPRGFRRSLPQLVWLVRTAAKRTHNPYVPCSIQGAATFPIRVAPCAVAPAGASVLSDPLTANSDISFRRREPSSSAAVSACPRCRSTRPGAGGDAAPGDAQIGRAHV